MSGPSNIPLCRSEFLQDFTIHLGLIIDAKYRCSFTSKVDTCEHDGKELERFTIWITTVYRTRINLTLWEDKTMWISIAFIPENGERYRMGFYPNFELLGFERVIESLMETVSISTRLCYDESPEPLLRRIWNYSGEVKTEGVL